jgi:hypothetical protein
MQVHQIQQLVIHRFGAARRRVPNGFGRAMPQVIFHQGESHGTQGFLDRGNLHQDVGAIPILFYKALQTSHLPFDPPQTLQVGGFDFRIDGQRFAAFFVGAATASRRGWRDLDPRCLFRRHGISAHSISGSLYYTPSPYVKSAVHPYRRHLAGSIRVREIDAEPAGRQRYRNQTITTLEFLGK